MPTVRDVVAWILTWESEFALTSLEYEGIFYWKACRLRLRDAILKELGLVEGRTKHDARRRRPENLIRRFVNAWRWAAAPKVPVALWETPRLFDWNGIQVQPYTYGVKRALKERGIPSVVIRSKSEDNPWPRDAICYVQPQRDRLFERTLQAVSFIATVPGVAKLAEAVTSLGLKLDLDELIRKALVYFQRQRGHFLRFFRRVGCREFFVVCSHGKEGCLAAAAELGIRTTEIQHGNIDELHLGYHFPGWDSVPYCPDRILTFSDLWFEGISFSSVQRAEVGSLMVGIEAPDAPSRDIDVVVVSQWTVSSRLTEFSLALATAAPELSIVYKPHPRDVGKKVANPAPNWSYSGDESLYQLLRRSRFALGVYSTGIFEAPSFGAVPLVLDMPGVEFMDRFLRLRGDRAHSSVQTVADAIRRQDKSADSGSRYLWFKPYRPEVILDGFDEI